MNLEHQDWTHVYVHLDKSKTDNKSEKKNITKKKGPSHNLDKTDINTFKNKKVDENFSVKMKNSRNNKKMTQKELAQKINVKTAVINDYESGKAIPNPKTLNNIKRILGI